MIPRYRNMIAVIDGENSIVKVELIYMIEMDVKPVDSAGENVLLPAHPVPLSRLRVAALHRNLNNHLRAGWRAFFISKVIYKNISPTFINLVDQCDSLRSRFHAI